MFSHQPFSRWLIKTVFHVVFYGNFYEVLKITWSFSFARTSSLLQMQLHYFSQEVSQIIRIILQKIPSFKHKHISDFQQ